MTYKGYIMNKTIRRPELRRNICNKHHILFQALQQARKLVNKIPSTAEGILTRLQQHQYPTDLRKAR